MSNLDDYKRVTEAGSMNAEEVDRFMRDCWAHTNVFPSLKNLAKEDSELLEAVVREVYLSGLVIGQLQAALALSFERTPEIQQFFNTKKQL